jgi:HEAT repeat protein
VLHAGRLGGLGERLGGPLSNFSSERLWCLPKYEQVGASLGVLPLRLASLEGLGECRRVDCATELASVLGSASDEETAVAAARALGSIGSSWAWKALGPAMAPTAASVRETAAQALLAAFSQHGSEARAAIAKAIVMLEHPDMPARISAARVSASAPLAAEFDALGKLVAQHAVR